MFQNIVHTREEWQLVLGFKQTTQITKNFRARRLILFKHVRVRRGRCSSWRGCESEGRMKQFLRRWPLRMTGHGTSYNYEHSVGGGNGQILTTSLAYSIFGASRGLYLFMNQFEIDRLIFQSRVSQFFVPQSFLMCNPDSRSPAGFKCQRGNPA